MGQAFLEQSQLVGPNAALCENMAHTYNSLGDYDNAEKNFSMAMELAGQSSKSKKGGIFLGLGLVKERKGSPKDALPFLQQALQMYQVPASCALAYLPTRPGIYTHGVTRTFCNKL